VTGIVQRLDLEQLWCDLKSTVFWGTPAIVAYLYIRTVPVFQCPACSEGILLTVIWEMLPLFYAFLIGFGFWVIVLIAKISIESLIERYTVQQGGDE
jgi:hypothetical protein